MSLKALQNNCFVCEIYWQLRSKKLAMEDRPCPVVGKKQASPQRVKQYCPTEWICPKRQLRKAVG